MKTIDAAMILLLFFYAANASGQSDYSAESKSRDSPTSSEWNWISISAPSTSPPMAP